MRSILIWASFLTIINSLPQYHYPRPHGRNFLTPPLKFQPSHLREPSSSYEPQPTNHIPAFPDEPKDQVTPPDAPKHPNYPEEKGPYPQYPEHDFQDNSGPSGGLVHKHIYVHVPPPEIEEEAVTPEEQKSKEKHYRIIFIKTPTFGGGGPVTSTPVTKEEKTLIYVLVKKPEEVQQNVIPTPDSTVPSKPEVYFVKYKPVLGEQNGGGNGGYKVEEGAAEEQEDTNPSYLPPSGYESQVSYI